jgi:hypothetical protein
VNAIVWQQTPDKGTWRAAVGDLLLTASKLSTGNWVGLVEGPGVCERSPEHRTRVQAQQWGETHAGVSK